MTHSIVPLQDDCCTVLIGDSRAHDLEGLDSILDDYGPLFSGGSGPRLHAFDHQFPAPSNTSAPQVGADRDWARIGTCAYGTG